MGRPAGAKNKAGAKKPGRKPANGASSEAQRTAPPKMAAAPAPESLSNSPTPEETSQFLAEFTRLKTQARRVAGDISALGKQVKGRGGPAYWKALKDIHDLKKMDPDEARAQLEALVTVAAQQEIRIGWIGNQATFADIMEQNQPPAKNTKGSRDLAAARAEADGYNSGKNGAVPSDNPFRHAPGSEEYAAWHNGRDSGAADAARRNGPQAQRIADAAEADDSLPDDDEIVDIEHHENPPGGEEREPLF